MSNFGAASFSAPAFITSTDRWGLGNFLQYWSYPTQAGLATAAWPALSLAIFCPIIVPAPFVAVKLFVSNGVINGNLDVGIYDEKGTRIVSSGSTPHATATNLQEFAIASTLIGPGIFYLAMSADGTANVLRSAPGGTAAQGIVLLRMGGVVQMAAAFPLPANAVFAQLASRYMPMIGMSQRTLVK